MSLAALQRPVRGRHAPALPGRPGPAGHVPAALRGIFTADGYEAATERVAAVPERLGGSVPKVTQLLEDGEEDVLAFYLFPSAHWFNLYSTNPYERVNREVGRRSDVVGTSPTMPP